MSDPGAYTSAEFENALQVILSKHLLPSGIIPCTQPKAILLGGQSGAGKTTLHGIFRRGFNRNVVCINGDEYRSGHPRDHELDEQYGKEAVEHTAKWTGAMTEAVIDALSSGSYNLIIEGTLRTAEVPTKTATLLRSRGYDVSLALMAVKPQISLLSCQIHYEMMRIAGTVPRATDPAHHNKIVRQIVDNLSVLEQSNLFSSVELYARTKERLYPRENETRTASDALAEVLFDSWTNEEKQHLAYLENKLAQLKEH